ncbi:MAG TPA: phosphate ABC transporter permease PstA [Phycisphaerales bacterium]|nr:phosphate ABC transporter permease PstA [Phycisphaerales bacterium]
MSAPASPPPGVLEDRRLIALVAGRRRWDIVFAVAGALLVAASLAVLGVLLATLVRDGAARLAPDSIGGFVSNFPSRFPARAGIRSALAGTALVMFVTMITAIPLGVMAGIYLEEYARKNWVTTVIEINIANLAGVPSIIWGLMALGLFVYTFGLGRSILTAGLTLGLLVLPIVIVATREAIRAIPQGIREASFACGATKLQTVRHHILPYSMPGILTGSIIALSRAIGETAPLITIGALTYIAFLPPAPFTAESKPIPADGESVSAVYSVFHQATAWLQSEFTVLPIQMFNWVSKPNPEFHVNAAATGLILLAVTLVMNTVAITLRYRLRRRIQW